MKQSAARCALYLDHYSASEIIHIYLDTVGKGSFRLSCSRQPTVDSTHLK